MNNPTQIMLVAEQASLDPACLVLRREGYAVTGVQDPRRALAAQRDRPCDILISAWRVDGFDGVAFAQEAQALNADAVVILMGDGAGLEGGMDAVDAGFLECVREPLEAGEVRRAISRAVEMRRLATENGRLEKAVSTHTTHLEAVNTELDAFAGRIAHDLQAVMQVNEGFATALANSMSSKLDDRERHYLDRIVSTSARGNRLVNDLLAFARLGVHPVAFQPVALTAVLERAREMVQPEAQGRQVEWSIAELPTVWGDASLLQQVFVNLLSNALKYTRGRDTARIRVEAAPSEAGIEVRIGDNGVGFDPAYAGQLFRPFERLHSAGQFEGNGMGLANVKRIVERHGGSVRAQTQQGEGALFAFTLPGGPPDGAPEAPNLATQHAASAAQAGHPALRVLVIDDDPMVLLSLRNMLEIDGHAVTTVAGGQIGVEAFERAIGAGTQFEVVITDFGMPHMNGGEVARRIKSLRPDTAVIMLTGWGARVDALDDWQAHVDDILAKPPRLAELRRALSDVKVATP